MRQQQQNGFTLIELMVTVAIVGILAAIAYPSYQDSVMKSRRADAKVALMNWANDMERYFTVNNRYDPVLPLVPPPPPQNTPYYTYSYAPNEPTANTYILRAVPAGAQANDKCVNLLMNQTSGVVNNSAGLPTAEC